MKLSFPYLLFTILIPGAFLCLSCTSERAKNPLVKIEPFAHEDWPFRRSQLDGTIVMARGATPGIDNMPRNSLPAMKYLDALGDFWMSVDVRITVDSVPILFGDANLERLTNGYGKVEQHTFDELSALLLRDVDGLLTTYHIPEFERVLRWNANEGKNVLALRVRDKVPLEPVVNMIENSGLEKSVIFIANSVEAAKKLHSLNTELVISVPVENMYDWKRLLSADIPLDRVIADTGSNRSSAFIIDSLHSRNIPAVVGTNGEIDRQATSNGNLSYKELIDSGVDIISTNRPLELWEFLTRTE